MASNIDLSKLDALAFEETLAYLRAHPEPQPGDVLFQDLLDDAVKARDWMGVGEEEGGREGESRLVKMLRLHEPSATDLLAQGVATCNWEGCQTSAMPEEILTKHLQTHATQVLTSWAPGSQCQWQGCSSKAVFKSHTLYKAHLRNIHTKPLLCKVPKCTHKKPFRNNPDLERHRATAHSEVRPYECPFETCEAEIKTFARKDKWLQHIRDTEHQGDAFCPHFHCAAAQTPGSVGFTTRDEIVLHFHREHAAFSSARFYEAPFRCALGSCALNEVSENWPFYGLDDHLKACHGISGSAIYQVGNCAKQEGPIMVLRAEHIWKDEYDSAGSYDWHDCTLCAQIYAPDSFLQLDDQIGLPCLNTLGTTAGRFMAIKRV